GQLAEPGHQPLPGDPGVLLETLLLDDVEDRETDRRRHGVPTERVEVLHPVGERLGDRSRRHDRAERMAVADRLAHRHDVRPRPGRTERPRVDPDPPEPDLDLVGDRDRADRPGRVEETGEPAARWDDLTGDGRDRLRDHGSGSVAASRLAVEDRAGLAEVRRPDLWPIAAMSTSVRVRQRHDLDIVGRALAAGPAELVRAHLDEPLGVAVVRAVDGGDIPPAGRGSCQAERQLVRLAPGVDEVADFEMVRQERGQPVGIAQHELVEIAGVRVQLPHLGGPGLDDPRVRVADVRDVVDAVEVGATVRVVQVRALAPDDVKGRPVAQRQRWPEETLPGFEEVVGHAHDGSAILAAASAGSTADSRSSSCHAGASETVRYGSPGSSRDWCALSATLVASRRATSSTITARSSSVRGSAASKPSRIVAITASGSSVSSAAYAAATASSLATTDQTESPRSRSPVTLPASGSTSTL